MATPANPGMTPSLPGAMSTRTDGGPASKQAVRYAAGEPGAEDFTNLQRQAPMAKTPGVKSMPPSQIAQAAAQGQGQPAQMAGPVPNPISPIPLGAPTQNPNEPVTNGAAAGPGAGPEALILPNQVQSQYENAYQMFQQMASNPNASPAMKYLAQRIGQGF
jgi:hypothetical protein